MQTARELSRCREESAKKSAKSDADRRLPEQILQGEERTVQQRHSQSLVSEDRAAARGSEEGLRGTRRPSSEYSSFCFINPKHRADRTLDQWNGSLRFSLWLIK